MNFSIYPFSRCLTGCQTFILFVCQLFDVRVPLLHIFVLCGTSLSSNLEKQKMVHVVNNENETLWYALCTLKGEIGYPIYTNTTTRHVPNAVQTAD